MSQLLYRRSNIGQRYRKGCKKVIASGVRRQTVGNTKKGLPYPLQNSPIAVETAKVNNELEKKHEKCDIVAEVKTTGNVQGRI